MGLAKWLAVGAALFAIFLALVETQIITTPIHNTPQNLKGKLYVVTGGTSGIGLETVKALGEWGAKVVVPARNVPKGEVLLKTEWKNLDVDVVEGDLANLKSTLACARLIKSNYPKLDGLFLNAGLGITDQDIPTVDDIERVFQVNHVAQTGFALELAANLKPNSKITITSSMLYYVGNYDFEQYDSKHRGIKSRMSNKKHSSDKYNDSKLMNVMNAITLNEKLSEKFKITVNAVHPGYVISAIDRVTVEDSALKGAFMIWFRDLVARDTPSGAVSQLMVGVHPDLAKVGGKYFSDHCMASLCKTCLGCDADGGFYLTEKARSESNRAHLWKNTLEMLEPIGFKSPVP